jgi:hypothetical protein
MKDGNHQVPDELLANDERDLRAVMERLKEHDLHVSPKKAQLFLEKVEFCRDVMRDGQRRPLPGKIMAIQKWSPPETVSHLPSFMGLTNYYSGYVPHYAELAAPLTSKLSVIREDVKKGSTKKVTWKDDDVRAFKRVKEALLEDLVLFHADPEKPFILRTDASDRAIRAVMEQKREGALTLHGTVPVAFFSRKLGKSQLSWTPREKETYAVVEALKNGPVGLDFSLWLSPTTTSPLMIGSMRKWTPHRDSPVVGPDGMRSCTSST